MPASGEVFHSGDSGVSEGNVEAGGRDKRGRSITRVSGHVRGDRNTSFTHERRPVGRAGSVRRGGRGRHYAAPASAAGASADDDGWMLLRNDSNTLGVPKTLPFTCVCFHMTLYTVTVIAIVIHVNSSSST